MPSRNIVKSYNTNTFYHVYNRGAGGAYIFKDAMDKHVFVNYLRRYATPRDYRDESEVQYPEYDIEVNAYCVMGNHFHLLLYIRSDTDALSGYMRSVSTAYSMYYNKKYKSRGHVFQSIFKAVAIGTDTYFAHITRYIHMNPRTYMTYKWSSLPAYLGEPHEDWLSPERAMTMTPTEYRRFIDEYTDKKKEFGYIKHLLADA